jgi:hypothetical protein
MWFSVAPKMDTQKKKKKTSKESGHAQYLRTILSLIVNIIGGHVHDHLITTRIYTLNYKILKYAYEL